MPACRDLIAVFLFLCGTIAGAAEPDHNWPRWRGPLDHGSIDFGNYPVKLDAESIVWQSALPGKGCSTPIVWQKMTYVTAPIEGQDAVLAFDWSGKQAWQTTFGQENAGKHRNGSGSNASPVTDGEGLFVYFKSGTLAAVNLDGSVRWKTNLVERFGEDTLYWDHGTSPVLTAGHVIMARMHHGESWLAAFDKATGEMTWKVARNFETPQEGDHGYATPLVIDHDGKQAILVWGAQHLTMHDPTDGSVLWTCGDFNPEGEKLWPSISTPVIVGDIAVIAFGRNDRGKPRLHGIKLSGSGDVTKTNHVWKRDDVGTFVPSPVAWQGQIYLVRDRGEVECLDPATGKTIWSDAFPMHRSSFYASPLIANGTLYAPREDGVVFVANVADDKFTLISENDMKEPVIGSPVPAGDRIFIRGEQHLFCMANKPEQSAQAAEPAEAKPLVLVSASYQKNVIALCELDGTVVWQFKTGGPDKGHAGHHEVQMLENGNILYHDDWNIVKEIKLDGTEVWRYAGADVHAFTRLQDGTTMIAESGKDRIIIVDKDGAIVSETPLGPDGRGKTRQAEVLENGNFLVCAEGPGTVTEYDRKGNIVWEHKIGTRVYGAIRLKNGNTLIGSGSGNSVVEVSPDQEIVWQVKETVPDTKITLKWTACLKELPNGHIIVDNCHAGPESPQLFELDQDRKVVWQFNQFELVGNGMACFDYLDAEQAVPVRKLVASLRSAK